jgi:hypothetical protein
MKEYLSRLSVRSRILSRVILQAIVLTTAFTFMFIQQVRTSAKSDTEDDARRTNGKKDFLAPKYCTNGP